MHAEIISIDNISCVDYKAKFQMPQLSLAWEKDLDYAYLRKVKRHLKTKSIRMQLPFPNEGLFTEITRVDLALLTNWMNELLSVSGFRSYTPEVQMYICNCFNFPTLAYTTLSNHALDATSATSGTAGTVKSTKATAGSSGAPEGTMGPDGKPLVKKGWMLKEGHVVKNWKKRHFVLENGVLVYYEKENNVNEKGRIYVKDYHITYASKSPMFNLLANRPTDKSFALEAADWNDSIAWRKAFVAHGLTTMGRMAVEE